MTWKLLLATYGGAMLQDNYTFYFAEVSCAPLNTEQSPGLDLVPIAQVPNVPPFFQMPFGMVLDPRHSLMEQMKQVYSSLYRFWLNTDRDSGMCEFGITTCICPALTLSSLHQQAQ